MSSKNNQTETPKRDAERSKAQILDAASELFANKGFDNVSLQTIAKEAGVARGTPHYFFKSKEGLFKACFERENIKALDVIPMAMAKLNLEHSDDVPDRKEIVSSLIDVYLDFLDQNPVFFRFLQWASLENNRLVDSVEAHWQVIVDSFQLAEFVMEGSDFEGEATHVVYSIIGLCTVHFSFGSCLGNPMQVRLDDKFLAERKKHIKKTIFKLLEPS